MRSRIRSMVRAGAGCLLVAGALAALGAVWVRPAGQPAPAWPLEARCPAPPPTVAGGSLLDEVGRLAGPAPAGEVAAWKRDLHAGRPAAVGAAWLHLWLGEVELGQNQAPDQALWHFQAAERLGIGLSPKKTKDTKPAGTGGSQEPEDAGLAGRVDQCRGLAAYDAAIAQYYAGAYGESAAAFHRLLTGRAGAGGFERRRCALWYRHAGACAGYHADRAKLGIPEPERLDPECGAAGLAVCLRGLGLAYQRPRVLAACRVTGEGSSLQDLVDACPKLGLSGRSVTADDAGLKALPKPLVAYVEHDHFIAVVRADAQGVTYVCSDCGRWPGGPVKLTWAQWHALEPGLYLAVTRVGGEMDRLLSRLPAAPGEALRPLRLAASDLSHLHLWQIEQNSSLLALWKGHVFAFLSPGRVTCGNKPNALHCPPTVACPMDGPDSGGIAGGGGTPVGGGGGVPGGGGAPAAPRGGGGPLGADPVNLATGEEEYRSGTDLTVYNPHGPAVAWSRLYNSMRTTDPSYQADDLGMGWTHPYNVLVVDEGYLVNVQAPTGGPNILIGWTGTDQPAGGATWDVVFNGTVVASSVSMASWAVFVQGSGFGVQPPPGATSGMNYEVRYQTAPSVYHSAFFDVAPPLTFPQGIDPILGSTGGDQAAGGLAWDITLNGSVVGSAAQPNGWGAGYNIPNNWITVQIPLNASISSMYEVRTAPSAGGAHSATFSVIASRYQLQPGTKYVQFPDGGRVSFTATAVPTASNPSVTCTAEAGAPLFVTWYYDAANPYGHYGVTFADGSKWVMNAASRWYNPGTGQTSNLYYQVSQMADRLGNAINFSYGSTPGPSGFPLLASISDASTGQALLTFNRAGDGTGNLLSVSDPYGRSVYYEVKPVACLNVPAGFTQSYQEVDRVSQIVSTGTANAPLRYTYGYLQVGNGDGLEAVPFLNTITVPSPTGTGNSTATINYTGGSDFVSSLVDANGNSRNYGAFDYTRTQVTIKNAQGAVIYSWIPSCDGSMHQNGMTDGGNSHVLWSASYSDPNNPHRPSSVTEGNAKTTSFTWDQYGNLLTATSPRGTQLVNTWDYSIFSLGRLTSTKEGTKTAATFSYFEPSGLVQTINTPTPGTSGGGTVATSFTYDSLGNILTMTGPGNNATTQITSTFNYTSDPGDASHGIAAYSQAAAIGQPLTATDNLGKVAHLRYNWHGDLISAADALGNQRTISYNIAEQPIVASDPKTGQTGLGCGSLIFRYLYPGGPETALQQYDESGALVRQISATYGPDGEGLSRTGDGESVTEAYDAAHRLISVTDGNNHATTFGYTSLGFLASVSYPGGGSVQFGWYDLSGRPTEKNREKLSQ